MVLWEIYRCITAHGNLLKMAFKPDKCNSRVKIQRISFYSKYYLNVDYASYPWTSLCKRKTFTEVNITEIQPEIYVFG